MAKFISSVLTLLAAPATLAHPGHGEAGSESVWAHQLTEPLHLVAWLAAGLAIVALWRLERRRGALADRHPRP